MNRVDKLIQNNTGYSSKNAALLIGAFVAVFVILNVFALLWMDLLFPKYKIDSDMFALAAIITAVEVVLGYLFYQKVKSESTEK